MDIILFFCIIIFLPSFIPWIGYLIYYKPLYIIFKNKILLSFYLYSINKIFTLILILSCANVANANMIIYFIIIICFIILYKEIIKDIFFLKRGEYKILQCNLNSLGKYFVKIKPFYKISGTGKDVPATINIRMDFYQYKNLLKKQKENINGIIIAYYLPNTKIMLNKFEYKKK